MASSVATGAPAKQHRVSTLVLAAILAVGIVFVLKYVFHYYLNYNQQGFIPYWSVRGWLMLHITSGIQTSTV